MNISQRTRTLITTTALLVAGTITLAGCTSTSTDADIDPSAAATAILEGVGQAAQSAHPVATETPTAKPTPADPAEGLATGDTVDAATAEEINASWGTYDEDKAYQMADGSYVLIRGGEPVPAEVTADANASLVELGATTAALGTYGNSGEIMKHWEALAAAADEKAVAAGKAGAVVMSYGSAWTMLKTSNIYVNIIEPGWVPSTREAAIAAAEAWVAKAPGVRTYFVAGS